MFEILPNWSASRSAICSKGITYARTFEKSVDGDITKLSLLFDQEIRCCMLGSSSMLSQTLVRERLSWAFYTYLYSLCIKAVCTTFGCCDAVAAAALTPFPVGPLCDCGSPKAPLVMPAPCSISGLLLTGGPIAMDAGGVTSMASPWSESTDLVAEGSIGMFLPPL